VACPLNQFSVGNAACVACALGQQPNSTRDGCEACPLGTFGVASSDGDISCATCPEESFQLVPGTDTCANATVCLPGNFTLQNLTATTDRHCGPCQPGTCAPRRARLTLTMTC
jgi:hypothetical protein